MTGTDLYCLHTNHKSVPVIFEPPCTKHINTVWAERTVVEINLFVHHVNS